MEMIKETAKVVRQQQIDEYLIWNYPFQRELP